MNTNFTDNFVPAEFDWLNLRFGFDSQSRNKDLEKKMLQNLSQNQLNVLDLGAGSAANLYYFFSKLPNDSKWTLIDRDVDLLNKINFNQFQLKHTPEILHSNFLDPQCIIYQNKYDLILANAVFDLCTKNHFMQLLANLNESCTISNETVLYFTINITPQIEFLPKLDEDNIFIDLFFKHMQREQSFGHAMGPNCVTQMKECFDFHKFNYESKKSNWVILPRDQKMLFSNLEFIENSCSELISTQMRKTLNHWISIRKKQITNKELTLTVGHEDLLAYKKPTT